jgi:RNA polymerase sigma-70 factor (ECF subfamily)
VALGRLLDRHRERLLRILRFRLDARIQGRVDPEDVLQDTLIEAVDRLPEYLEQPAVPFFVWLRFLAVQKLAQLHRHHLETQRRAAGRERGQPQSGLAGASSADLAARLLGNLTSPSEALARAEQKLQVEAALTQMDPMDREILTLRHFEQLANLEAAGVLGLSPTAASNRYVRAVRRLQGLLGPANNGG